MAKGGKGRKGGGGGGKTRKYARDNQGRFASTGTGATARGGRLKTASGNKRKTQTMQSAAAPKGTIGKPKGLKPGTIKAKAATAKPAPSAAAIAQAGRVKRATRNEIAAMKREGDGPGSKASRSASVAKRASKIYAGKIDPRQKTAARLTRTTDPEALRRRIKKQKDNTVTAKPASAKPAGLKFVAEQSGRVRRAALGGGRTAVVRKDQAVIINAKGTPIMTRKGLPNIAAGKKYAANPNARGPRLMGSGRSEALPSRDYLKTSRPTGTINKPKGLKPEAIKAAVKFAATRGARLGGTRRTTQAAAPRNTTTNRTGQSKTLNRFNSRPERTRGAYVGGRYVDKAKLTGRQALDLGRSDDVAFGRTMTKAARSRAAAPAKAQQKQTTAQRAARAASNQKRVTQAALGKGGKRPTLSRKQRRSIMTAESAKRFYATKAVDYLKVNVKKPGFRLPRGMR